MRPLDDVVAFEGPVSLEARVVDGVGEGGQTLGRVTILQAAVPRAAENDWKEVRVLLNMTASSGSDGCRFQLQATGDATARVGVTVVSLFPTSTWAGRPNGLRVDVASWLNESQPPFIRTPGGCYVEGHNLTASGWAWKKTLGPISTRQSDNSVTTRPPYREDTDGPPHPPRL